MSGLPKLIEDIEKARTFAPPDNDKEEFKSKKVRKKKVESKKNSEDIDINELFRDEKNEYLNINLVDVNNVFDKIKKKY